jgi:7-cyano-7-deazaguanine synthase
MSTPPKKPAVVLLSGGLDSATCLAIAQEHGFACHCISFDYGQRHRHELTAADAVAKHQHAASHRRIHVDPDAFRGSALTSGSIAVPKDRDEAQMGGAIPATYVPARNTIFLAYALGYAEVLAAADIFIGVNAVDYSGYPDCRPQFIAAFQSMANLATKAAVEGHIQLTIHAPLLHLAKTDIIRRGLALGVDYSLTHSCYDPLPEGSPCQHCDACLLRQHAFVQLGKTDPLLSAPSPAGRGLG